MTLLLNIFGGLGLFLLGMWLMTDGLKVAAGQALRRILRSWTDTPMRGLFSGFLITSLVQSSSAVTVATIGFVNAGILSLKRAIGVIYGSNLGTTTTAWLVALVGFHVNIKVMALPMIGLGMVLHIIAPGTRKAALGHALAGFGVFFLGIDVLKGGFAGLDQGWTTALPAVSGMVELLL
ncbi:MAG: Na/Pi symporter, partial [Desulfohalobiaceae bacterium]